MNIILINIKIVYEIIIKKNVMIIFIILSVLKLLLVSSYDYMARYSIFDDFLYTEIANNFYNNSLSLGSSNVLLKLPTFSYIIYFIRKLNLPYFFTINFIYLLSSILLIVCLNRIKIINNLILVIIYFLLLFNPVVLSSEWSLILREPIASILDIILISFSILIYTEKRKIHLYIYYVIFIIFFMISLYLREEDKIRFLYLIFLFIGYYKENKINKYIIISMLIIPIILSIYIDNFQRNYNVSNYGVDINNVLTDGEFPKFLSNLRRINYTPNNENRLILIKWQTLVDISKIDSNFDKIFRIIPPPNNLSLSCKNLQVCPEWAYPYIAFWILDATFKSRVVDNYKEFNNFYKKLNYEINESCKLEILKCRYSNNGKLFETFELKWFSGFSYEIITTFKKLLFLNVNSIDSNRFEVGKDVQEVFESVLIRNIQIIKNENNNYQIKKISVLLFNIISIFIPFVTIFVFILIYLNRILYPTINFTTNYIILEIYLIYVTARLIALSYVAVWMGNYEYRIFYSNFIILFSLSPIVIYELILIKKDSIKI